jgi:hypothetical protein
MGLAAVLACAPPAVGLEATGRKGIVAPRWTSPPVIDGRIDEAQWADAALITDLVQIRPGDGVPVTERTEVLVAYDDDALYVAARMYDSAGAAGISANILRQNSRLNEDDRLSIIVDPFNSARTGYRFEANLNGVRNDMLYQGGNNLSPDWTVIWETKAQLTDYGWSLEMAIPFKTLPFDPKAEAWGFNVSRAIRRKGEEAIWVTRNRTWNPSILGSLSGIREVDQGVGLDIVPSFGTRHVHTRAGNAQATTLEPSLDAYYRLTQSLNASVTVNTDFSATEVDDRQVNLTRFGLFFPEKRDFFLADSDLFEFGRIGSTGYLSDGRALTRASQESGRPYFSRRWGLSPSGTPIDIDAGGKLSGRVGRWRIGALGARQDDYVPATGMAIEARNLGVVRASADVLGESSMGFIATAGDPGSNLANSLYGFDFLFLNSRLPGGRTAEGEAWYQRSQSGIPGPGSSDAWGLGFRMPNNEGLRFGFTTKRIGEQFRPAQGFVARRGAQHYYADTTYKHFTDVPWLQAWVTGIDAERIVGLDGELQTQVVALRPLELENRRRDELKFVYSLSTEQLDAPFVIFRDVRRSITLPAGRYRFDDYGFDIETGPQRRVAMRASLRSGQFYDGDRFSAGGEVTWRPSRHVGLRAGYDFNDIDLPSGNFRTRILRTTVDLAFTSELSWTTLMQYDNVSEIAGFQSRLVYVPRAGQRYFFVVNHSMQDFDRNDRFETFGGELSLRGGYTFRF